MFLGDEQARTLASFLNGYRGARVDLGISEFAVEEHALLADFEKWLAVELNEHRQVGWLWLVESEDPTAKSVHTFFRRFEQFLNTRGLSLSDPRSPRWPIDEEERR